MIVAVAATVVGFAAGGYRWVVNQTRRPADKAQPRYTLEVLYTSKGFVPTHLQVPLGTRVGFRNATDSALWTASDPVGTHADNPDFVARRSLRPGEVFVYAFDRAGTYGYHNELRPEHRGAIQVHDLALPDDDLDKTQEDQIPVRDRLLTLLDPGNPQSVFRVVDTITADPALALSCHSIGHDLGHRAYELYGFTAAMNASDPSNPNRSSLQELCAGGYVHGVLEAAALHLPRFRTDPASLCAEETGDHQSSCFHGLGHAFMFAQERNVEASLASCRALPGDARYPCFEGVWMELFQGPPAADSRAAWDPQRPTLACLPAAEDAKPACFLYSGLGYLRHHYGDYAGAVRLCTTTTQGRDELYCLKGLGLTITKRFQGQHLEQAEPLVAGLAEVEREDFYQGVIRYARFSGISTRDLEETCNRFREDGPICRRVVGQLAERS